MNIAELSKAVADRTDLSAADVRVVLSVALDEVVGQVVAGETVVPQAGGFYGGWVTSRVVGPFKGEPGTWGW